MELKLSFYFLASSAIITVNYQAMDEATHHSAAELSISVWPQAGCYIITTVEIKLSL